VEVEPLEPTDPALKETIASMEERGISLLYGRWLIEGAPRVLLIDTSTGYRWLDEWKGDLWAAAGIPSPAGDRETNEAIVFGYLVAWFLGEVGYRPWSHSCCTFALFPSSVAFIAVNPSAYSLLPRNNREQS
jgi:glycogen synthase